ncbi:flagellar hook-associated protein FlgL [Petropleomorpha daqingensis]|uniref:Flagellar hook-associated protein 3 FlgL n=1 Tax=Petropleomorpha daqingensis TaxID=2026353 RepID=A0A853CFY6_9ACTN|nr:flagellar hook-associated protein FlgL [Petropleomorpha daqingensis]NYJ06347.1 flagellar hook-associated protein 3 FlgL [Petropleomorpha daqingensis]
MRITQRAIVQNSLQGLNSNLAAYNRLQQQLTSGKTISRPSDSPTGTNTSLITRQAMSGNAQYARNISDGQTFLDATDSSIQDMLSQLARVRDLTVQALNGGAQSEASQQAIATEVAGIRQSLLGQANQVVQGRPLFGGVTAGSKAYDDSGAYVGVGGTGGVAVQPLTRRVSDVETIRVDMTGPEAFGDPASGKDLFSVINSVVANVADTTALTDDLKDLDTVRDGLLAAAADIGTRSSRMQTAGTVNTGQALSLKTTLSDTEDVDLPKTIMEMQMQQNGYQAALQATAKVIQPTLLDFLK